jgi:magnesium transporter
LKTDFKPYFDNLDGEITQLKESFDATNEEISNLSSALLNSQTINTNNIVRILTLISAIFLPLALITGLYGTNFIPSSIPDLQNPVGFYVMLGIMIAIALILVGIFKRKGWF